MPVNGAKVGGDGRGGALTASTRTALDVPAPTAGGESRDKSPPNVGELSTPSKSISKGSPKELPELEMDCSSEEKVWLGRRGGAVADVGVDRLVLSVPWLAAVDGRAEVSGAGIADFRDSNLSKSAQEGSKASSSTTV